MATKETDMNDEQDAETGQFTEKYATADFLDVLRDNDGMATTSEVAEGVDAPRRTAYGRLEELHDEGVIGKRSVGAGVLWVLPSSESESEVPA
jgi:GTP-sensing pleiotropic transcriptional regulator CodY